jgi:hypothetical protein
VAADHVLGDTLDVLGGDSVETFLNLARLDRLALEHLTAQAEHDHPLGVLELEQEPPLGEVARLLELGGFNRLVDDSVQLAGDRLDRFVGAVDVDPGLRVQGAGVRVARIVPKT